jgi:two-component system, NtrC family, response regulator AtoC
MPHAILVDDDAEFLDGLCELVRGDGFTIETAGTFAQAKALLEKRVPDLLLLDVTLPDGSGFELLKLVEETPSTDVVVVTGHSSVDSAVEALRQRATDYLTKPLDVARLRAVLTNVTRRRELYEEVRDLRAELRQLGRFGPMIGAASSMQPVYDAISRVAPTNATVLIQGESGTGKELVAETLHRLSRRRKQAFIAINCSAVSPNLIESDLFGHERGSFTGADKLRRGFFERASGGTLFLDEVTEMPQELQAKLLRVLETGHVVRVGGEQELPIDVRVIAATNRVPEEAVAAGKLRQDLLYRLSVFRIGLPSVRERAGDIDILAEHFLASLNRAESTDKRFARATLAAMRTYGWPGNVRELKNAVHSAYILADDVIEPSALPPTVREVPVAAEVADSGDVLDVRVGLSIAEAERRLTLATLRSCGGKKDMAAKVLGISLKTLYNRLNLYRAQGQNITEMKPSANSL